MPYERLHCHGCCHCPTSASLFFLRNHLLANNFGSSCFNKGKNTDAVLTHQAPSTWSVGVGFLIKFIYYTMHTDRGEPQTTPSLQMQTATLPHFERLQPSKLQSIALLPVQAARQQPTCIPSSPSLLICSAKPPPSGLLCQQSHTDTSRQRQNRLS